MGAKQGCTVRFDEGINQIRLDRGYRNGYPTERIVLGEPIFQFFPVLPTVLRSIETTSRSSGLKEPGLSPKFPHSCIQNVGVGGIHRQFGTARSIIHIKDPVPGIPSISAFVNPSLLVRVKKVAQGGDIKGLRVFRVNENALNAPGIIEPHVFPILSPVVGDINAISVTYTVPGPGFSGSYPYGIGVVLYDGDIPDGLNVVVENGFHGGPPVCCFPYASPCCPYV